jgi:signal transduction histidine kinase
VILNGAVVAMEDALTDPEYARSLAVAGRLRRLLGVPMLRAGKPLGVIVVGWDEPGAVPKVQQDLLTTFADQAVIAIENVRLFNELEARNRDLIGALERETATGDVLKVISRSAFDLQPVLDTVIETAARLCGAEHGHVYRCDGELLRFAAGHSTRSEMLDYVRDHPITIGPGSISGTAAMRRAPVHWHDVLAQPDYQRGEAQRLGGYRTVLAVPMLRGDDLKGVIVMWKTRVEPFTDKQVDLVATFADQAVIAIENVRLFNEVEARNRDLTEALEQQTATSDILRVISRSRTDAQPVFDIIAANALKLCHAKFSTCCRVDGDLIHLAALHHLNPEGVAAFHDVYPCPPSREGITQRAILTGRAVQVADVLDDREYVFHDAAKAAGYRSVLSVPLLREGRPIGAISVFGGAPRPFSGSQVELLETFAEQAVIAIENMRLFSELEMRTRELTRSVGELQALGEVGRAVSSTLNLETVLATIVARATELAGLDGGSIWEYDDAREEFRLHAANRLPDELVDVLRGTPIRKGEGALGRLAVTGEPVEIADIANEHSYPTRLRSMLTRHGYRSILAVPLLREDQLLGALAVNRNAPGDFAPEVVELMKTFATQSALAIQNARLFREIEQKSRELEAASRHKSEFLANMSHELRTPLNAIIGFSEVLAEQLFGPVNEKQADYLRDILESGRHLLALINDILDLSKIEAGRMELEASEFDLPRAIENALILVRERASRHGIELVHEIDPGLGAIRADERKVKQVLLNLLTNALKFTADGGRVEVRARAVDGSAEISVADTGIGIAAEDQAAVFEEFRQVGTASKKVEGTGLGLAISRKFIELHGGRIGVTSAPGIGSTFAFTLPLR